jgi:hypothetical protein
MDPEILKLIEKAVREGVMSAAWPTLVVAVIVAGLGVFLGSFLKKMGEDFALRKNFSVLLQQLETQTRRTAAIQEEFANRLESLKALLGQDVFVRELYAEGIRQYSSEQAYALRQAYLLVYEPSSSAMDSAGKDTKIRLEAAIQCLMQPLRKHIGLLDEQTIDKIYKVQKELLELMGLESDELRRRKNQMFNATEVARQFVKVDLIAHRLGLIQRPLIVKEDRQ